MADARKCPECGSTKIGGETSKSGEAWHCLDCSHRWSDEALDVPEPVEPPPLAHIVTPASKMHDVLLGSKSKVRALCGAWVRKAPESDAPVCRSCFDELATRDRNEVPEPGAT